MNFFLFVMLGLFSVALTLAVFMAVFDITKSLKKYDETFKKLNPFWTAVTVIVATYVFGVIFFIIGI